MHPEPCALAETLDVVDGRPVRVLRPATAEDAASAGRLEAVAAALERAAGTGLPRLIRGPVPGQPEVVVAYPAGRSLDRLARIPPARAAQVASLVAALIADLHDRDIGAGAPAASDIIVTTEGTALLHEVARLSIPLDTDQATADVHALGSIIERLVGTSTTTVDRPLDRSARNAEGIRAALLSIADRAALCDEARTGFARSLATQLAALDDGGERPGRRMRMVWTATACVAAVAATLLLSPPDRTARRPDPAPPVIAVPAPGHPTCAGIQRPEHAARDLDEDGCGDVLVPEGATIRTSSGRFVLGDDDDQVLLADVRCEGAELPVLLRRPEGAVYVFEEWAAPDQPVQARAQLVDPDVVEIRSLDAGSCPTVVALRGDGTARGLPLQRSARQRASD